jgi:hypothetical protein
MREFPAAINRPIGSKLTDQAECCTARPYSECCRQPTKHCMFGVRCRRGTALHCRWTTRSSGPTAKARSPESSRTTSRACWRYSVSAKLQHCRRTAPHRTARHGTGGQSPGAWRTVAPVESYRIVSSLRFRSSKGNAKPVAVPPAAHLSLG